MRWFQRTKRGSRPIGFAPIQLAPSPVAQYYYQEKQPYNWPSVPAHETRAGLTNAWQGNQLPGPINFIPGVQLSKFTWNVPTHYMNSLINQQYNKGFNTQGMSSVQSATLQTQILQAWQNRSGL